MGRRTEGTMRGDSRSVTGSRGHGRRGSGRRILEGGPDGIIILSTRALWWQRWLRRRKRLRHGIRRRIEGGNRSGSGSGNIGRTVGNSFMISSLGRLRVRRKLRRLRRLGVGWGSWSHEIGPCRLPVWRMLQLRLLARTRVGRSGSRLLTRSPASGLGFLPWLCFLVVVVLLPACSSRGRRRRGRSAPGTGVSAFQRRGAAGLGRIVLRFTRVGRHKRRLFLLFRGQGRSRRIRRHDGSLETVTSTESMSQQHGHRNLQTNSSSRPARSAPPLPVASTAVQQAQIADFVYYSFLYVKG